MIATEIQPINVACIASCHEVREWEDQALAANSPALQSPISASRLLSSPKESDRRIAVLSFRYRWPIDRGTLQQIVAMASGDEVLELRLIALSLIFVIFVRSESRVRRNYIGDVIRSVAEFPNQAEEIASSAKG